MKSIFNDIIGNAAVYASLPIYKKLWSEIDCENITNLAQLPSLHKTQLSDGIMRNWMHAKLQVAIQNDQVEYNHTSGTSGARVEIVRASEWWQKEHVATFTQIEALKNFSFSKDKRGVLSTAVCSNTVCHKSNRALSDRTNKYSVFLNYHSDPNTWEISDIKRIQEEVSNGNFYFLDADPFYLACYLRKAAEFSIAQPLFGVRLMSLDYEKVLAGQMSYFRRELPNVKFINLYGSTELGCLYVEDEGKGFRRVGHGSYVEFLPFDVSRGLYELVVTSLKNEFMPFIRYETGDIVQVADALISGDDADNLTVKEILGRKQDLTWTRPTHKVTAGEVDRAVFASAPEIINYRITVEAPDLLLMQYVSCNGTKLIPSAQEVLHARLTELYGSSFTFSPELVVGISPKESGKYLTVLQRKEGA